MRLARFVVLTLLACALGMSAAQALNQDVEVVNNSTGPLLNLYASKVDAGDWKNLLPTSSRLDPKAKTTFTFDQQTGGDGACMRDIKLDFDGASKPSGKLFLKKVNICKAKQLIIESCKAVGGFCARVI